jgi:uncharacterized protein (DUF2141 family)
MPKQNLSFLASFLLILFISNCAQQVAPNGGSRDTKAPEVASTRPLNRSTNFDANKIVIKFNENIQIKDPSQIVISPLLKEKPAIDAIANTIEIEFLNSKPEINTTYTINFGNGIADVNEGNIINDYSYVFSTGYKLDSNTVSGKAYDAFTNKPEKDVVVGLYKKQNFKDSVIFQSYPSYFGKSKENGDFSIQNLPNDTFILIAFKDQNLDSKYQKNEKVAFNSEPIIALEEKDKISLKMFDPNSYNENTLIDSLSRNKGIYQFCIYKPKQISIKPKGYPVFYTKYSRGKEDIDTINIYIPNTLDSSIIEFEIRQGDTMYNCYLKTKNKSKYKEFNVSIKSIDKPTDSIHIYANLPIENLSIADVQLKQDSTKIKPNYFNEISKFEWVLYYPFQEGNNYSIAIKDSAFKNIYSRYNKTTSSQIVIPNAKSFGNLILTIENIPNYRLIFQLVEDNPEEKVIIEQRKKLDPTMNYNYLNPGNYKIKIIEDSNNNGVWDTGNLALQQQPEKVYYHNQVITIKAYWDIEQNINLKNIITN